MLNKVLFFVFAFVIIGSTIFSFLYLNGDTIPDNTALPSDDSMCKGNRIENAKWNRFSKQKTVETAEAVRYQFSRCSIQLHEYELENNSKKCQRNRDIFYFLANHGSVDLQKVIISENLYENSMLKSSCYAVPITVNTCKRWVSAFQGISETTITGRNANIGFINDNYTDQEIIRYFYHLNKEAVLLHRDKALSSCENLFQRKRAK